MVSSSCSTPSAPAFGLLAALTRQFLFVDRLGLSTTSPRQVRGGGTHGRYGVASSRVASRVAAERRK